MTSPPEAADPPVRLVALPHLDLAADPPAFLGEPLPGDLPPLPPRLAAVLAGAQGYDAVDPGDRPVLDRYVALGAVVAVPVPADGRDLLPGAVVVAPHPDDAVLALGATLAGSTARVVTAFSVETQTRLPYYAGRPGLAITMLVAEDAAALRGLGVTGEYLGYVDAADRPAVAHRYLGQDGAAAEAAEPELVEALAADLAPAVAGAATVLAPLGVGGHVDHLLCRAAVLRLVSGGLLDPARVALYPDMPYAALALGGADVPLPAPPGYELAERANDLAADRRAAKAAALSCYRLQLAPPVVGRVLRRPERVFGLQGPQVR